MKPNRKDLRRLKTVQSLAEKTQSACEGLSDETKKFLSQELDGVTESHLEKFERNINTTIEFLKDKEDVRN